MSRAGKIAVGGLLIQRGFRFFNLLARKADAISKGTPAHALAAQKEP
jgi:hypothetical protein